MQFLGAKLKVARAGKHLSELNVEGNQFFSEITRSFVVDKDSGMITITTLPYGNMRKKFPLIIGDVLHNLRAALDHAAIAMICPPYGNADPSDKALCFPIVDGDKAKYEKAKKTALKGAAADAVNFIDSLEPHVGGKYYLSELHQLDIIDKHKLLVVANSYAELQMIDFDFGGASMTLTGSDFTFTPDFKNASAKIPIPPGKTGDDFHFGGNYQAKLDMRFGHGMPLADKSVYPALQNMHDTVKEFVEKCELHFLKSWVDISSHLK